MNKYYIHLSGGVGDCLFPYFIGRQLRQSTCGGMGFLHKIHKDDYVKIIAHPSQKESIKEFFKYDPRISEIKELYWRDPNKPCTNEKTESEGFVKLDNYGIQQNWERKPNKQIYTSKEDNKIIENIINKGPFVLMHPFAGEAIRIPFSTEMQSELIEAISNEFNCNIVMVGATHHRDINKSLIIRENCIFKSDRFINLVNKGNFRISAKLVQLAKAIVVTHSVVFCVASHGETPCVVTIRDKCWTGFAREKIQNVFIKKDKTQVLLTQGLTTAQIKAEVLKCLHQTI